MGNSSRAAMLDALLGGRWLAAGELAAAAEVSRPTASGHLARLQAAGLIVAERQGRHRYFALAGPHVAEALEALGAIEPPRRPVRSLRDAVRRDALAAGRTCFDHLAGRLGVALTDALIADGWLAPADDGWAVTTRGAGRLAELGVDVVALRHARRAVTRRCTDVTERRPHLGGGLGAALAAALDARGWTHSLPDSRAVRVTEPGRRGLRELLDRDVAG